MVKFFTGVRAAKDRRAWQAGDFPASKGPKRCSDRARASINVSLCIIIVIRKCHLMSTYAYVKSACFITPHGKFVFETTIYDLARALAHESAARLHALVWRLLV